MNESMNGAVTDFNNQSVITRGEFKAWLAGIVVAMGDQPMNANIADAIVTMALRLQPDRIYKTEPDTTIQKPLRQTPCIPQSPYTPNIPWENPNKPIYPGIPPIWCTTIPFVGDETYNIMNTGSTNGSKT